MFVIPEFFYLTYFCWWALIVGVMLVVAYLLREDDDTSSLIVFFSIIACLVFFSMSIFYSQQYVYSYSKPTEIIRTHLETRVKVGDYWITSDKVEAHFIDDSVMCVKRTMGYNAWGGNVKDYSYMLKCEYKEGLTCKEISPSKTGDVIISQ